MSITGVHALLYSPEAEAVRRVLADDLGWDHVDTGGGWLVFALPPAEIGVHPSDAPSHEISLICDDLDATVAELRARGIEIRGEPSDEGWGIVVELVLPGDVSIRLYEPRHPLAIGS